MNWHDFAFASYEIVLAIVFSLITIFISKKVFVSLLLRSSGEKNVLYKNPAIALFGGVTLICQLILVHASLKPAVDTLKVVELAEQDLTFDMFLTSFSYFMLFFIISLIVSQVLILVTTKLYFMATRQLDEIKEIKENNLGVSIIISAVVLGITLSVNSSFEHFLSSMVNYNQSAQTEVIDDGEPVEQGKTIIFQEEDIK